MPQHSSHIEMVFSGHKCQKAKLVLSPDRYSNCSRSELIQRRGKIPHKSNQDRRRGNEHLGGWSLFTTGREKTQVRDIRTIRKMGNHMQKKTNQTNQHFVLCCLILINSSINYFILICRLGSLQHICIWGFLLPTHSAELFLSSTQTSSKIT